MRVGSAPPGQRRGVLASLAWVSAGLSVLALLRPDWVEALGIEPDQGSGLVEWLIPAALAIAAVLLGIASAVHRALSGSRHESG